MTLRRTALPLFLLALCLLALRLFSFAQTETATLSGLITDPQGKVVPDVAVDVTNIDTNANVHRTTSGAGLYVVVGLKPGRYRVSFSKEGFRRIDVTDLVLNVQDVLSRNFELQLGPVTSSITVVADTSSVNTADASVSTVIDRKFAEELPLNGRSFQALFQLTPGVVTATTSYDNPGQFNINGQRGDANYFMVDGVGANISVNSADLGQSAGGALPALTSLGGMNNLVSVDALQEFRIQTSTYAPEFGRTPGGQIGIVTRSGTSQFHGSLFDYFRNDVLDANDWFANQQGLKKPPMRQNDFGGVLGGPILKDRTFFFFSYEGLRLRQPKVGITEVPSLTARQNAPATTQPLLNAFPIPNGPDLGNDLFGFSGSYSDPSTLDATSIRIDHTVNGRMNLFGRYNYAPSSAAQRGAFIPLSNVRSVNFQTQTLTLGTTLSINQQMTNDLRFNYSRVSAGNHFVLDSFGGADPPSNSILFPSFASPNDSEFGFVCCGFAVSFTAGHDAQNQQQQFNVVDGLSLVKGSHHLKFGVDYRRLLPVNGAHPKYTSGFFFDDVAQVLTGVASFASVSGYYASGLTLAFNNFSAYAQDTWNATRRLSLTYGIRWDLNPPPHVTSGGAAPWAVTQTDDPSKLALAPPGTPLWQTRYGNFAPRIGLAYQLSQSPRWGNVLRGGFGIFYDLGYGHIGDPFGNNEQYYGSALLLNAAFPLDPSLAKAPPPSATPPFNFIAAYDPHLKSPYTYEWNLSFEQSVGASQTFTVSDVGAIGRRLPREDVLFSPSPDFNGVAFITHSADTSDYHSLQVQYKRRLSKGLQGLASYTWSHSIDTASSDNSSSSVDPGRGPSDFDIRHSFSGALSYVIPTPSRRKLVQSVLGGWSLDAKVLARSATPVNLIAQSFVISGSTFINARPDVVPGVPFYVRDPAVAGGRRINSAAFAQPSGLQGNLGRNALRGFGATQLDFTLRREFSFTERWKLQFSADFFNIFNHPNFANPDNTLTDPLFGRSLSMLNQSLGTNGSVNPLYQIGGPRSTQLVLKLVF